MQNKYVKQNKSLIQIFNICSQWGTNMSLSFIVDGAKEKPRQFMA